MNFDWNRKYPLALPKEKTNVPMVCLGSIENFFPTHFVYVDSYYGQKRGGLASPKLVLD